MSRDRDDELADLLDELADTLRRLEAQVEPDRPRRGPFGLPPPPSPRDVMAFTGEYAIPTAIAVLRANVKMLELVGAILRAGATADESRQRGGEAVERLRGETASHLERALAEIQEAIEEGDLPQTPEARDVVEEARRLNADLREYVREADETVEEERQAERRTERRAERGTSIPIEDGDDGRDDEEQADEDGSVEIDVEEELKSIKEGMGEEASDDGDEAGDDNEDDGDESEGSDADAADETDVDGEGRDKRDEDADDPGE
jgi:hypothetical protein